MPLPENKKLDRSNTAAIECRRQYKIKEVADFIDESERSNETYRMFANLVSKNVKFMQQWVRCYVLTH